MIEVEQQLNDRRIVQTIRVRNLLCYESALPS